MWWDCLAAMAYTIEEGLMHAALNPPSWEIRKHVLKAIELGVDPMHYTMSKLQGKCNPRKVLEVIRNEQR